MMDCSSASVECNVVRTLQRSVDSIAWDTGIRTGTGGGRCHSRASSGRGTRTTHHASVFDLTRFAAMLYVESHELARRRRDRSRGPESNYATP